jgi:hypothetical protein
MAELLPISSPLSAERKLDVVFVHGLGGDPITTWRSGTDENTSWPHWLALEFGPQIGVWSLGYAAAPTKWEGVRVPFFGNKDPDAGAAMSLPRRAENALDRLVVAGIGQRPVCFITHSLGGLLVKNILRKAADSVSAPEQLQVVEQCRGVLFLATPHHGSRLADVANAFRFYFPTVSTLDLKDNDDHLMDLYEWYRSYAPSHQILTRSYYENKVTKGVVIVVSRSSADPGVTGETARRPTPLDQDHLEISKPRNQQDQAYIGSTTMIRQILRGGFFQEDASSLAEVPHSLASLAFSLDPRPYSQITQNPKSSGSEVLCSPEDCHPKIFISYSHDNKEHCAAVLSFAQRLRSDGFDALIDRFVQGTPIQGWPRWMLNQLENADFIILVCTKTYYRRFRGIDHSGMGKGVDFEGAIITNELYYLKSSSQRFVPVFVSSGDIDHIPEPLRHFNSYRADTDYDALTDFLSGNSGVEPVGLGPAPTRKKEKGNLTYPSSSLIPPKDSRRASSINVESTIINYPAPGGTMGEDDLSYIKRSCDRILAAAAAKRCETIVIKGPRKFGKSSLLRRYLTSCRTKGKHVVAINFLGYEDKVLSDYSRFLTRLGADLARRLKNVRLQNSLVEQDEFLNFLEDDLLSSIDKPVVLAFDETDRILQQDYAQDFFSMIRMWHNERSDPTLVWNNVGLALVTCSEPKLFILDPMRSPFNVGEKVLLCPFQLQEVEELNHLHGTPLTITECTKLHSFLGGHPFLTREAFYIIVGPSRTTFQLFIEGSSRDDGPFGDHLRALISNIQLIDGLNQSLIEIISQQAVTRTEDYYRLNGAGIVLKKNNDLVFSNDLYYHFFKRLLVGYGDE